MAVVFADAEPVRQIAEQLIREHHPRLPSHRVRFVYLFSDQEPKTHGKRIFGDLKIISNLGAHLAEKPAQQDFELPSFVCTKCKAWKCPGELAELDTNGDIYEFCKTCFDETFEWDWTTTENRRKLQNWTEMKKQKRDGGFDPGSTTSFFVMVIYRSFFDWASETTRKASINHLLCHAGVSTDRNGNMKLYKAPHDVEEFSANVALFGVDWMGDLHRFADEVMTHRSPQLTLIDTNGDAVYQATPTADTPPHSPPDAIEQDGSAAPQRAFTRRRKSDPEPLEAQEEQLPAAA